MRIISIILLSSIFISCQNKLEKETRLIKSDTQNIDVQKPFSKSDFLYLAKKTSDSVRKQWSLPIENISFYVSPMDTIIQVNDKRAFHEIRYSHAKIVANVDTYEPYPKIFIHIYADTSIANVSMLEEEMRTIQDNQESLKFRVRTIQLYNLLFVLELNKDFDWSINFLNRLEILIQRIFIEYFYHKVFTRRYKINLPLCSSTFFIFPNTLPTVHIS